MKEQIKKEIEQLKAAEMEAMNAKYFRFETFSKAIEKSGLPYRLVQTWERGVRGNLYYWTGAWDRGAIYVQETEAGRKMVRGIAKAIGILKAELERRAA